MAAGEQEYIFSGENPLTFPKQNSNSTYVSVGGWGLVHSSISRRWKTSQQLMGQTVPQLLMAGKGYSYGKKHFSLAKACVPVPGSFCGLCCSRAQQLL